MAKYIKSILLLAICAVVQTGVSYAQESSSRPRPAFAYDVDMKTLFNNGEFYKSDEAYVESKTIFGVRLAPALGLALQTGKFTHKLMLGADLLKDFGAPGLHHYFFSYYSLDARFSEKTRFEMKAGIFPRKFMKGDYSEAFFYDSITFYDNNLEGMLFSLERPKATFEIGIDWLGKYSQTVREKFMFYSSGNVDILPYMDFGYAGYLYHYANTYKAEGVVDNVLLNLWLDFSLEKYLPFQKFQIRTGWIQAAQNDRKNVGSYVFPCGFELLTRLEKWNFGISNRLYVGGGLMPYYDSYDNAGIKYGSLLYMGSPLYRNLNDSRISVYDYIDIYYRWNISKVATLMLDLRMHFKESYAGMQQIISLKFNLNEIIRRK